MGADKTDDFPGGFGFGDKRPALPVTLVAFRRKNFPLDAFEIGNVGQQLIGERGVDKLRLRLPMIFHMQRGLLRYSLAQDLRDEMKGAIDPGGKSSRRDDLAVIHVTFVSNDFGLDCELFEVIEGARDRCRDSQRPSARKRHRNKADRRYSPAARVAGAAPRDGLRLTAG